MVTLRHDIAGVTDTGVRDHNEDCIVADGEHGLALVADGMGGHAAGEIASGIARDVIVAAALRGQALSSAVLSAHTAIQHAALEGSGRRGMGTTVVAARLQDHHLELAWVGDSRAYLWDGQQLLQLSRDHSYVESLLASEAITLDEARHHPQRNLITQALGVGDEELTVGTYSGELGRGQILLLCSDGLNDEVDDQSLAQLMAQPARDSAERAKRLVAAALEAGGRDNVSAVVVTAAPESPLKPREPRAVQRTSPQGEISRPMPVRPAPQSLLGLLAAPLGICVLVSLVLLVLAALVA